MSDLNTQAFNVTRSQSNFIKFTAAGLLPTTTHAITLDGVDWGFATKQVGKDFGAALVSNVNGELTVELHLNIEYNRDQNFELPRSSTLQFQNDGLSSGTRRASQTVTNYRIAEVSSFNGQSKAQIVIPVNILLTSGPVSTLFPIE